MIQRFKGGAKSDNISELFGYIQTSWTYTFVQCQNSEHGCVKLIIVISLFHLVSQIVKNYIKYLTSDTTFIWIINNYTMYSIGKEFIEKKQKTA